MFYSLIILILLIGLYVIHPLLLGVGIILFLLLIFFKKINKKYYLIALIFFSLSYFNSFHNVDMNLNEFVGIVNVSKENYFTFFCDNENYYVKCKENEYNYGDILKIKGKINKLSFASLEGEFNFEKYINEQNIIYELEVKSIEIFFQNPIKLNQFKKYLLTGLNDDEKNFYKSFLFSDSTENTSKYINIGLYSILSSSGLLMYFFIEKMNIICLRFFKTKKAKYFTYILSLPVILFSNFKLANVKVFFLCFNKNILNSKFKRNDILSCLIMINCVFYMKYIFTTSFFYTFFVPFLIPYLNCAVKSFKFRIRGIAFGTLVFLLYIPINIIFNKSISILSFLFVYAFKSLFAYIFVISYVFLLFPFRIHFYKFVFAILKIIISILEKLSINFYFYNLSVVFYVVCGIIIVFIILFYEKNEIKKGSCIFIILICYLYLNSSYIKSNFDTYVTFINVGQGDSALIHNKKTNILIDTGGSNYKDIAKDVLIPFLEKRGINKIDYVFLSHSDIDHAGAYNELKNYMRIDNVIIGSIFENISINGLTFYNLNEINNNEFENSNSSVIKFKLKNYTYLFTGDIDKNTEMDIIQKYNVDSDILKVAHHGSDTSSSIEFLKAVSPKLAIISVGKNNLYNHPSKNVISRLETLQINYLRTDEHSSITIYEHYFKNFLIYCPNKKRFELMKVFYYFY